MGFSRKRGVAAAALACALALAACADGSPAASADGFDPGTTSGPAWSMPASALLAPFSADAASAGSPVIDASHASEGYVAASATSEARLKLQVASGDMSYNYDLPSDGTPIVAPLNMGDGAYRIRVMQNTSGNNYVELHAVDLDVTDRKSVV